MAALTEQRLEEGFHGRSVTANALNDFLSDDFLSDDFLSDYGDDLCVDGSGSIVVRPLCVRFLCEQSFLLEATFPSFAFSAFSR